MEEKSCMPPYSNRGAVNTSQSGLIALVDWVSVTFTEVFEISQIFSILGMIEEEFSEAPTGNKGYKKMLVNGHIAILYDGKPEMGIHVDMSGQGCREFENYFGDWAEFFKRVFEYNGQFTRLDLAIDDYSGYFKIDTLIKKAKKGEVRSKFKKAKRIEQIKLEDGSSEGNTLYFGRPSSRIQIRFYEKHHERKNAGKELEEGVEIWNRSEIQSRHERATSLAMLIANGGGDQIGRIIMGTLKNYILFLSPSDDTNKARWPIAPFWDKFLGDIEPLKLSKRAPDRTIERIESWIDRQVNTSLGILFYTQGIDSIIEKVENGIVRMRDQDHQLVEEYLRYHKKNSSTEEE